jgi:acyl carrier protein
MMDETATKISEIVCRIGELSGLDPAEDIYAAGLESVRALEVLLDLETEFEVTIPDDAFILCRTVNDLTGMVERLRAGAQA